MASGMPLNPTPTIPTTPTLHQRVLTHIYHRLVVLGYKIHSTSCYRPILNRENQFTYAWERVCDLSEFIETEVPQELIASLGQPSFPVDASILTDFIMQALLPPFRIAQNRHLLVFHNGVLHTKNIYFYALNKKREWGEGTDFAIGRLGEVDSEAASLVCTPTRSDASFKIFPGDFPDELIELINNSATISGMDAFSIPTPTLDHIFDCQRLTPDMKKLTYAMLGRLLFDSGLYDNFKVGLLLGGVPCSGKSTVLHFISSCFSQNAVFMLRPSKSVFAWEGLQTADLAAAYNFTNDSFVGEQKEQLEKFISGGWIKVDRIGKAPLVTKNRAPFVFVGELPSNPSNLADQMCIIPFLFPVASINVNLQEELKQESPHLLAKMVIAYRKLAVEAKGGNAPFGKHLSSQMKQWREDLMAEK